MKKKQYKIIRLGEVKRPDGGVRRMFSGVYAAARGIKRRPQTVYDYLNGRTSALSKELRDLLVIV